jgi:hypothetical protein
MAAEPSLLGARLLLSRYQSVSNAGRHTGNVITWEIVR